MKLLRKLFTWFVVLGMVFWSYIPAFAGSVGSEIAKLKSRIAKLEQEKSQQGRSKLGNWRDRVHSSGLVEVEANYQNYSDDAGSDTDSSDVALASVELGLDADIAKYVDGHLLLKSGGEDVFVDEGTIHLGGVEDMPFYLIAGKFVVPFGKFNSHFVSDPLTLEIGESNDDAVTLGYANDYFDVAVGAFNGDIDEKNSDDVIEDFVASAVFTPSLPVNGSSTSFGVSYTSSIAESCGLEGEFADTNVIDDYVGALSAFVSVGYKNLAFEAEYVGALDEFQSGELLSEEKSEPMASNFELAYAVNDKLELAGRGEFTDGLEGLFPEEQYGPVVSYSLFENTSLTGEYLHGEYENGVTRDRIITQLAIEF